jgi:hypothetical protein
MGNLVLYLGPRARRLRAWRIGHVVSSADRIDHRYSGWHHWFGFAHHRCERSTAEAECEWRVHDLTGRCSSYEGQALDYRTRVGGQ